MVFKTVTENEMMDLGLEILGLRPGTAIRNDHRFKVFFGASPNTCSAIFRDIQVVDIGDAHVPDVNVKHFLMALHWLRMYQTELEMVQIFKIESEKTVRKWIWIYTRAIQALRGHKIPWVFQDRYDSAIFTMSVDGTHCPILEPRTDPDKMWFSHKFNGPGVAYEIGLSLRESRITWLNGPFKAGNSDLVIFRSRGGLKSKLIPGMLLVADGGYPGEKQVSIRNPFDDERVKKFKQRARARHESLNGLLKKFKILRDTYRHAIYNHRIVFEAVAVIVQYKMEDDIPVFCN